MDRTLMLLDDAPADPQPESGSFLALCSVERRKQISTHAGGNTRTVVDQCDAYAFACGIVGMTGLARVDDQSPLTWHGFNGVADQVGEDLAQLSGKAAHAAIGRVPRYHFDL